MTVRIRFFADWFAELPLWIADGRDVEDVLGESAFPDDLYDRLRSWCGDFTAQPKYDAEWQADFQRRGRALAEEVAAHLGPGYVVEYEQ